MVARRTKLRPLEGRLVGLVLTIPAVGHSWCHMGNFLGGLEGTILPLVLEWWHSAFVMNRDSRTSGGEWHGAVV